MSKKLDRQINGPSMTEVLLGAVLSLLLGVVLAVGFLVLTPATTVKELPKEPVKGAIYYIEGSRDASKARQAATKQKTFIQGGSIALNEDEINMLVNPPPVPAAPAKKGAPAAEPSAPAPSGKAITPGAPTFRIRSSDFQIGVPIQLSVFGFEQKVILHSHGGFVKNGDTFEFVPTELYLGSCPLQRLPGVQRAVVQRVMAATPVPEEVRAAWAKLSAVSVEGAVLNLTM